MTGNCVITIIIKLLVIDLPQLYHFHHKNELKVLQDIEIFAVLEQVSLLKTQESEKIAMI